MGRDEILLRGPMLLRRYRDGEDPKDADGWYATGDLGHFDDGRLVVDGRRRQVIVTGGENVLPGPVEEVRGSGGDWIGIGVSRHEEDQVNSARFGGADYAFVGMTFPTRSHPEAVAIGIDGVRRMAACAAGLPAIAIGGMGPEQAAEVVRCGAYGVAAIRGVWNAANPADAVMAYLAALEDC